MPKRTDIKKILIIGSGPIVIGQACEFDYSGTQACKALRADGYEVVLVNSNPATIMTDPEVADRTYIEPLTRESLEQIIAREKPDALLPTVGGQTGLNLAVELAEGGVLEKYGVELIGASLRAIKVAEDRLWFKDACRKIGLDVPASALVNNAAGRAEAGRPARLSRGDPAVVHAGRHGRLDRLQPRGVCRGHCAGAGRQPGARGAGGRVGAGLEGIRTRGDARFSRQLRGGLLDREFRSHGRAHRRLDHRGARADADRQGIPADARRLGGHHPRSGRGDGRLEHSVRHRSGQRAHGGDRDESARFAQLGAGLEGHRLSRSPKSPRGWRWA